jgi:predicted transcriptional regulator of viral defense system
MQSGPTKTSSRGFIADLAAGGRYHFVSSEARGALGVTPDAAKLALRRLAKQGLIASPARGFYVIVPPEYRSLGCLPADQFIPALMKERRRSYYAGLLTAAQYHGAAHQRPQAFQVFVDRSYRPFVCGKVRVAFMVRKRLRDVPVQQLNTPRGTLRVSTPEATAIDLIGYQQRAGGMSHVATVLLELAERLDVGKLPEAAETAPVTWAQRLGFVLDHIGASDKAVDLREYVRTRAQRPTPLVPGLSHEASQQDVVWKVYVNADLELDL